MHMVLGENQQNSVASLGPCPWCFGLGAYESTTQLEPPLFPIPFKEQKLRAVLSPHARARRSERVRRSQRPATIAGARCAAVGAEGWIAGPHGADVGACDPRRGPGAPNGC